MNQRSPAGYKEVTRLNEVERLSKILCREMPTQFARLACISKVRNRKLRSNYCFRTPLRNMRFAIFMQFVIIMIGVAAATEPRC